MEIKSSRERAVKKLKAVTRHWLVYVQRSIQTSFQLVGWSQGAGWVFFCVINMFYRSFMGFFKMPVPINYLPG